MARVRGMRRGRRGDTRATRRDAAGVREGRDSRQGGRRAWLDWEWVGMEGREVRAGWYRWAWLKCRARRQRKWVDCRPWRRTFRRRSCCRSRPCRWIRADRPWRQVRRVRSWGIPSCRGWTESRRLSCRREIPCPRREAFRPSLAGPDDPRSGTSSPASPEDLFPHPTEHTKASLFGQPTNCCQILQSYSRTSYWNG